jgi:hypothetical protein
MHSVEVEAQKISRPVPINTTLRISCTYSVPAALQQNNTSGAAIRSKGSRGRNPDLVPDPNRGAPKKNKNKIESDGVYLADGKWGR